MVRSLSLESLIIAAAVLNVQWMKLELLRQFVELWVVGIIKGVPGHEASCDRGRFAFHCISRRTCLCYVLVKKNVLGFVIPPEN